MKTPQRFDTAPDPLWNAVQRHEFEDRSNVPSLNEEITEDEAVQQIELIKERCKDIAVEVWTTSDLMQFASDYNRVLSVEKARQILKDFDGEMFGDDFLKERVTDETLYGDKVA